MYIFMGLCWRLLLLGAIDFPQSSGPLVVGLTCLPACLLNRQFEATSQSMKARRTRRGRENATIYYCDWMARMWKEIVVFMSQRKNEKGDGKKCVIKRLRNGFAGDVVWMVQAQEMFMSRLKHGRDWWTVPKAFLVCYKNRTRRTSE